MIVPSVSYASPFRMVAVGLTLVEILSLNCLVAGSRMSAAKVVELNSVQGVAGHAARINATTGSNDLVFLTESNDTDDLATSIPTELGQICWNTKRTPGVVFATYASGPFVDYLPSFQKQVDVLGGRLLVYGPENVSNLNDVPVCTSEAWDESETPCVPKGYAASQCFQWKPRIVKHAFHQMKDNEDVLIYFDSRSMFVGDMGKIVDEIRIYGSLLFLSMGSPAVKNVKRAVWDHLGVAPDSNPHFTHRMSGSVLGLSKHGKASKMIVDKWVELADDPYLLCNGRHRDGKPEFEGFKTHQHDQSVITAICVSFKDPSAQCHGVDGGKWMTYMEAQKELVTKLNVTCGAKDTNGALHGDFKNRLKLCVDHEGPMADKVADPDTVRMLSKYVIGKKFRAPGREDYIGKFDREVCNSKASSLCAHGLRALGLFIFLAVLAV